MEVGAAWLLGLVIDSVAALTPPAGEGGALGLQEIEIIAPAIQTLRMVAQQFPLLRAPSVNDYADNLLLAWRNAKWKFCNAA